MADRFGTRRVFASAIPILQQAIETAALMLGSDRSRGYCLEMICADFLAGAHTASGYPEILVHALVRSFMLLNEEQKLEFLGRIEPRGQKLVS